MTLTYQPFMVDNGYTNICPNCADRTNLNPFKKGLARTLTNNACEKCKNLKISALVKPLAHDHIPPSPKY